MAKQFNSSGQVVNQMQFARNDLRVLTAIRDCGFVRANQLREFLIFRGFKRISLKQTYAYTNRLVNMGLAELNRRALRWNAGVFSVTAEGHAAVTMTLTTPHCPVAESMPGEVELRVGSVPGVGSAEVNLVWDPPWDRDRMSETAQLALGMI